MMTLGKRVSSCAAAGIVWVGGSVCLQLVALGALYALLHARTDRSAQEVHNIESWAAVAMPILACCGGSVAVWLLRQISGWPKLPVMSLFLHGLVFSIFSLMLMPTSNILVVATTANLLAIVGALITAWRESARAELGTHLFPDSTKTEK